MVRALFINKKATYPLVELNREDQIKKQNAKGWDSGQDGRVGECGALILS